MAEWNATNDTDLLGSSISVCVGAAVAVDNSIPGWLKVVGVLGVLYVGGRACDSSEEKKYYRDPYLPSWYFDDPLDEYEPSPYDYPDWEGPYFDNLYGD